ncbi:MAG: hypothetical protein Q9198_000070 [Flavoplaca austrocitrina]
MTQSQFELQIGPLVRGGTRDPLGLSPAMRVYKEVVKNRDIQMMPKRPKRGRPWPAKENRPVKQVAKHQNGADVQAPILDHRLRKRRATAAVSYTDVIPSAAETPETAAPAAELDRQKQLSSTPDQAHELVPKRVLVLYPESDDSLTDDGEYCPTSDTDSDVSMSDAPFVASPRRKVVSSDIERYVDLAINSSRGEFISSKLEEYVDLAISQEDLTSRPFIKARERGNIVATEPQKTLQLSQFDRIPTLKELVSSGIEMPWDARNRKMEARKKDKVTTTVTRNTYQLLPSIYTNSNGKKLNSIARSFVGE